MSSNPPIATTTFPSPTSFSSTQKNIDFVQSLPEELSLIIFQALASIGDTFSLLNCYRTSKDWERISHDFSVLKALFENEIEEAAEHLKNIYDNLPSFPWNKFHTFSRLLKDVTSHPMGRKSLPKIVSKDLSLEENMKNMETWLQETNQKITKNFWDISRLHPNRLMTITEIQRSSIPLGNRRVWTVHGTKRKNFQYHDETIEKLTRIPPAIFQMTALTTLIIPNNKLRSLPEELKTLTKLTLIDVRKNPMCHFPRVLEKLASLDKVFLPQCIDKRTISEDFKKRITTTIGFPEPQNSKRPTHQRKRSREHFQHHRRKRSNQDI